MLWARQHIQQLYRSMYDRGLLARRDFASLARYARSGEAVDETPRELRPKNAYNLLRLIASATDWLRTGEPRLEVGGALREELLAIKRGEVALDEVLARAEARMAALEEARAASPLPAEADIARVDRLLRRVREEVARRWLEGRPGPLGAGAPPPKGI